MTRQMLLRRKEELKDDVSRHIGMQIRKFLVSRPTITVFNYERNNIWVKFEDGTKKTFTPGNDAVNDEISNFVENLYSFHEGNNLPFPEVLVTNPAFQRQNSVTVLKN